MLRKLRSWLQMLRVPFTFFCLVVALSLPLWTLGAATDWTLFLGLPLGALQAFCPAVAALLLTFWRCPAGATRALFLRSLDYERISPGGKTRWYVPILLLMPAVMLLSYALMRGLGLPLPDPLRFSMIAGLGMAVAFFIGAIGEELGWSGYAIDRMQGQHMQSQGDSGAHALFAAIVLGLFWAAWHVIPFLQAHRSPGWIVFQGLQQVATRVLLVWIYNNTGKSVFAASLYHASGNVSVYMFPNFGSHYDPRVTAPILVAAATIVALIWSPRTLTRHV